MVKLSVIIPVLNEEGNVKKLHEEITKSMPHKDYEIIFIDDGSWDNTFKALTIIKDKRLKVIKFRTNFGQSAAMDAGFKEAKGKIIIAMDGDLQNDPKDIPKLLAKIEEGYDVVSGWRHKRKDPLSKHIPSRIAYMIRKKVTKLDIHDSGCSLKAYKKEALEGINLTGEMHRYIPDLCKMNGFRVGEVKVNHRARVHGTTKYKASRMIKGLLDLVVIFFWQKFAKRPIHFFGGIGLFVLAIGGIIDAVMIIQRLFFDYRLSDRPLFILANFAIMLGLQFFLTGILADILMKNHYEIKNKMNYSIEKVVQNK